MKRADLLTLEKCCVLTLMRHHTLIDDVAHIPYALIRQVLQKLKAEQLVRLEKTNPLLILGDEEIWYDLLKKDFPLNVHEQYVSRKNQVYEYYLGCIKENDEKLLDDKPLVKNYFHENVKKDPVVFKYRLPSRLLYYKYQQEVAEKQELSAERLRQSVKQLQAEKEKMLITMLEDPIYVERELRSTKIKQHQNRSNLYLKSYKEHLKRQEHFKSGGYDPTKRRICKKPSPNEAPNVTQLPPRSKTTPKQTSFPPALPSPSPNSEANIVTSSPPEITSRQNPTRTSLLKRRKHSAQHKKSPSPPTSSTSTTRKIKSTIFSSPTLSTLLTQQHAQEDQRKQNPQTEDVKKPRIYIHSPHLVIKK
ncbi:elongin A Ecym_6480 [Eremothecium cymbalariae DBVPG|uniref:Elongin-A n=1 Tax=Eremothecium cymbalariae (strain CBS 270.75 / DBVPG 7215 / KCTC 17166 / NRRL Y-17582) TaxID=931890 RepID=G8JUS0_ERECY|nr:hypothetical protein Ecym_6480 [Eremothecium cymbalariae DBVPG\